MANDQLASLAQKWSQTVATFNEKLQEQVWFQQLKTKWDELDSQNRLYLKFGAVGGSAALVFFFTIAMLLSVKSLKQELIEKTDLLTLIQASNEEIRTLKDANAGAQISAPPSWKDYFEQIATSSGLDKSTLTVAEGQPAGGSSKEASAIQETLFDLKLTHVNIKQVVKFAYQIENSGHIVRLRALTIDTGNDPSGYLNTVVSVSSFSQTPGKGAAQ